MFNSRKRRVRSCIPCYTKKQKCSRTYPCDNCTRRRKPDECAYCNGATRTRSPKPVDEAPATLVLSPNCTAVMLGPPAVSVNSSHAPFRHPSPVHSLAAVFGYHQGSDRNTIAVLRRFSLENRKETYQSGIVPLHVSRLIQHELAKMPRREILDFLIQYYVSEIHWHDQILEPRSFKDTYRRWWTLDGILTLLDVEFAVVIMRICSYASLFLPSPTYNIDAVRGMKLADIRSICSEIGDTLFAMTVEMDRQGSLFRVQHLLFSGLKFHCEGNPHELWVALGHASQVAKELGLYDQFRQVWFQDDEVELDKELGCRAICLLYIWDNQFSRQLDIAPLFSDHVSFGIFAPDYQLASRCSGQKPHPFTERALQVELCKFWRNFGVKPYDLVEAEERYEKFSIEFLAHLPPAFSLNPDKTYDSCCPKFPLQRHIFHIAVFESICCNFRPVLATNWEEIPNIPSYKRVLISSQKKLLAATALKLSAAVGELYDILGAKYTRSVSIVFYTFEAAVLLGCLCLDLDFTNALAEKCSSTEENEGFLSGNSRITKEICLEAMANALARLEVLSEVSILAEAGAQTLSRLLGLARSSGASPEHHSSGEYSLSDEISNFLNNRDKECVFKTPEDALFDQTFSNEITELDLDYNAFASL
ncbi:hypothetical protein BCR34DRAFT_544428 [Clohesyomyces aquaticus]|uniref:Zn(2)-C6 fungal-type domain-containing protein n=1 Tax=Clohesyomyces aquaticus TaxID=1231657 RepID=A0A1Y1Z2C7_9PLEO|nr:hypothetical protein BCR34DRAFT_544428 [Clohesyomyces aquaticus]